MAVVPVSLDGGFQTWNRFVVLEEKARKCGCKLKLEHCLTKLWLAKFLATDLVSPELVENAKANVSFIMLQYLQAPQQADLFELSKLKYYCTVWNINPDIPDQCKDLWLQLKATLPQEPLSLEPSDPTQIDSFVHKERISDLCSEAYKLQLECLKEGLTLGQIPSIIKTRAVEELQTWEKRATLGAGMEIYQEWKEIVTVLVYQIQDEMERDIEHGNKDGDTPQQKQIGASSLDVTVEHFLNNFVSTAAESVTAIVNSIDEQMDDCSSHDTSTTELQTLQNSSELLKEIEALRVENEALKVQLTKELDELKKENSMLKQKLRKTKLQHTSETIHVSAELQTVSMRTHDQSSQHENELSETTIKHFNAIPKALATFYQQMENGDECLVKFECLPEVFKKNKRTKGVYSKRKTVYTYIQNFEGGWEAFLRAHEKFSTLQVYEQVIKRSRV